MTTVVADTHVHIYPFYKVEDALNNIAQNLGQYSGVSHRIACLTERYDCELYAELRDAPRASVIEQFSIKNAKGSLKFVSLSTGQDFHLLPGQQVITGENIEILSLNCEQRVVEGKSAPQTVEDILSAGGIPVVAWAPGKWFFARGNVVLSLMDSFSPNQLAFGDTTLRPIGWTTPTIIKRARERGFKVLFGSDPLPFAGEEKRPGTYLTRFEVPGLTESSDPSVIMGSALEDGVLANDEGSRGSFPAVLNRLYRNHRAPTPARA